MQTNSWWKWLILVIITSFSVLLVIPTAKDENGKWKQKLRLGLDLQGGYSFTVELDKDALAETIRGRVPEGTPEAEILSKINAAAANADETAVEIIRNRIDALGTSEPVITRGKNGRIYVQIPGATEEKRAEAEKLIRSVAFLDFRLVSSRSSEQARKLLDANEAPRGYKIATLSGEKYYVREKNTEEIGALELQRFGNPDPSYVFMLEKGKIENTDVYSPCFVGRRPLLTGENITKADTELDPMNGKPEVTLAFDSEGAKKFSEITGKFCPGGSSNKSATIGRRLAIVLDGVVYSSPVINERIDGGHAVISGSFDLAEANQLRTVLNAGAMPAPLKFLGKRFVSPTLGEDSIASAKKAVAIGFLAVIGFVLFYYRFMGIAASIALLLDLILMPVCAIIASGCLSLFSSDATMAGGSVLKLPVLTLPGIAGILLTIGMAVDANVLTFERTREEQLSGRPAFPSILAGYQRAFLAIFDGNLTTVITGIILFIFGTGLIRGFAVTLIAGIIASMYTALVVTKMFFQATVSETRSKPMKMMQFINDKVNVNFTKYFKPFIFTAVSIIVVTNVITVSRALKNPADVFAVDFTGGAKVSYTVANPDKAPLAEIRKAANAAGITDAQPQYQKNETGSENYLDIKTVFTELKGREVSEVLTEALTTDKGLEGAGFKYTDIDSVGSQIGSEMKKNAYIAIALSAIAMLIYIAVRFEFGFSLGAITATVHDVFMTIGVFACLGFQFDLTIVAAMLTIVGYGVNDTIVLFDRIREELKKDQKMSFVELTNHCINLTLSRTILTSGLTLMTVLALLVFTSGDIFGFAVCMLIGLISSTFSTVFIASPVMLAWYHYKRPNFNKGK